MQPWNKQEKDILEDDHVKKPYTKNIYKVGILAINNSVDNEN